MTINKRKKNTRQRGTHTHGYGSKKKHRGAGSRGGHGGTGKRGDSLKPSIWKNLKYFGRHGFKSIKKEKIKAININDLQDTIRALVKKGFVQENKGVFIIDLAELGYNKLLGTGKVKDKFQIKVKYASGKAIERIESAEGKVELTGQREEKESAQGMETQKEEEKPAQKPETKEGQKVKREEPVEEEKGLKIKSPAQIIREVKGQ